MLVLLWCSWMKLFESSSRKAALAFFSIWEMVTHYVYKVANGSFCQIFYNLWLLRATGVLRSESLTLPMATRSNPSAPGLCARWGDGRRVVTPPGPAAREETQNNRQGNPTQNNELASTKRKVTAWKPLFESGGGGEKRVSEGNSMPLRFQRIPFGKENNAGEQCKYLQCFWGSRLIFYFLFLLASKLELLP